MNKQEIEHKLEQAQKDMMGIKDNILWLKEQLAEAEKPKRRHGDFGLGETSDKWPRLTLESFKGEMYSAGRLSCERIEGSQDYPDPIFGNIFDIMEDWGKPFNRYEAVVMDSEDGGDKVLIEPSHNGKDKIFVGSKLRGQMQLGIHLSETELQGFWIALGHALMELKRKQS